MNEEKMKIEIERLVNEATFKLESLPESYFIEYFEKDFIKILKEIIK